MKKYICILGLILVFKATSNAQSISNQVIGSNGFSSTAGGAGLDFTVGELVVLTLDDGSKMITQGFHQTYQEGSSVQEENPFNVQISTYPNPAVDEINIQVTGDQVLDIKAGIFDNNGKLLYVNFYQQASFIKMDISTLAAGNYFLKLWENNSGQTIKTIKILKLTNQ